MYTEAQRDALQTALASGVLTVKYEGKEITYRSITDLKRALDTVSNALAQTSGDPATRQIRIYSQKGF